MMLLVVGGLIGTATSTKNGLLSNRDYLNSMQYARFESNRIYRVGKLSVPYSGIMLIGGETTTFTPIHIVVSVGVSGAIKYGGTKPQGLTIKYDPGSNIYVSGLAGKLFALRCFSIANDTLLALNEISSYPSGAVDVPSV